MFGSKPEHLEYAKIMARQALSLTMDGTTIWKLKEAEEFRLRMYEAGEELYFFKMDKKRIRRRINKYRKKLKQLSHLNAKKFEAEIILSDSFWNKVVKQVFVFLSDDEVKFQCRLSGFNINTMCEINSDDMPELLTFQYILRDPNCIELHPESKYAKSS